MISLTVYAIIISLFFLLMIILALIIGAKIRNLFFILERLTKKTEYTIDSIKNLLTVENIVRYFKKGANDEWK